MFLPSDLIWPSGIETNWNNGFPWLHCFSQEALLHAFCYCNSHDHRFMAGLMAFYRLLLVLQILRAMQQQQQWFPFCFSFLMLMRIYDDIKHRLSWTTSVDKKALAKTQQRHWKLFNLASLHLVCWQFMSLVTEFIYFTFQSRHTHCPIARKLSGHPTMCMFSFITIITKLVLVNNCQLF